MFYLHIKFISMSFTAFNILEDFLEKEIST